jgi:hypothetical protein
MPAGHIQQLNLCVLDVQLRQEQIVADFVFPFDVRSRSQIEQPAAIIDRLLRNVLQAGSELGEFVTFP